MRPVDGRCGLQPVLQDDTQLLADILLRERTKTAPGFGGKGVKSTS